VVAEILVFEVQPAYSYGQCFELWFVVLESNVGYSSFDFIYPVVAVCPFNNTVTQWTLLLQCSDLSIKNTLCG